MGLNLSDGINDFFHEALRVDLHGKSLLMLGRQYVSMNSVYYYVIAERMGVELDDIEVVRNSKGDIDSFSFFRGLGFSDIHSMDVSDYEGADIIFDLNTDGIPEELHERFDYIVDGGTLEHVFHAGNALINIAKMLKIGGKVFHYLPVSGWINHGFYMISPCLLNEFYAYNGFRVEESNIVLFNKRFEANQYYPSALEDILSTAIDYRMFNLLDERFDLLHSYKGTLRCIAQKTEAKIPEVPIQRHWYGHGCHGHGIIKGLRLDKYDSGEIAIWGMGGTANRFLNMLLEAEFPMNRIKGFFASFTDAKEYHGYPVLNIENLSEYGIKLIVIAANLYEDEIYENICHLQKRGVCIIGLKKYKGLF